MVHIRAAHLEDISKISSVLAESWKSAYRGIVDDDYLDSLGCDHWIDFLTWGLNDNDIFAMVMENGQQMIGAAILSKTEKNVKFVWFLFIYCQIKSVKALDMLFMLG